MDIQSYLNNIRAGDVPDVVFYPERAR